MTPEQFTMLVERITAAEARLDAHDAIHGVVTTPEVTVVVSTAKPRSEITTVAVK